MAWHHHKDVVTQENRGGAFLLHMESGTYFGLDTIGLELWSQLKSPSEIDDLSQFLVQNYNLNPDQAFTDCKEFINSLIESELIVES